MTDFKVGDKVKGIGADINGSEGIIVAVRREGYSIRITKGGKHAESIPDEWGVGVILERNTFWKDYLELISNNNKTNMIQQLTEAIKRGLKPELHNQYKAGILNGALELTDEGKNALLAILATEKAEELNKVAEEVIAEAEKK